jgi:hypothetical protein
VPWALRCMMFGGHATIIVPIYRSRAVRVRRD